MFRLSFDNNNSNIIITIIIRCLVMSVKDIVIDSAVYARVAKAADELFANAGNEGKMPKVDDVRRLAAVSMNDASNGMKIWREKKLSQSVPTPVAVPDTVMNSFVASIGEAWQRSQQIANESLQAAQKSWELEREELEEQRISMAESFDAQAWELADFQNAAASAAALASRNAQEAAQQLADMQTEIKIIRDELMQAESHAAQSSIKAAEIEKRAGDLRTELDRSRSEVDELKGERNLFAERLELARKELSDVVNKLGESEARRETDAARHAEQYQLAISVAEEAKIERDAARKLAIEAQGVAGSAREESAELRGQLKGAEQQISELLKQIKDITAASTLGRESIEGQS